MDKRSNEARTTIYISAVAPLEHDGARAVLDGLREAGFDLRWFQKWRGYDIIEREIERCDALLAVVDDRWSSSSWMMVELHRALGLPASGLTDCEPMKPIPAFVYMVHADPAEGFLQNLRGSKRLPADAKAAIEQIVSGLR